MNGHQLDDLGHRAAVALQARADARPRPRFRPAAAAGRLRTVGRPGGLSVAVASVVLMVLAVSGLAGDDPPVRIDPVPEAPTPADRPPPTEPALPTPPPSCDEQLDRRAEGDRWEVEATFGRIQAMVVDELVHLGTGEGDQAFGTACLFALDPETGAEIWSLERRQFGAFWPVQAGDVVVAASLSAPLVAFDAATGRERWRLPYAVFEVFLDDDGNLLGQASARGRPDALVSVDAETGRERWRHEFEYGVSRMVLDDDRVAVTDRSDAHVFDVDSGELLHGPFDLGASRAPVGLSGDRLVVHRPLTNLSVFDVTSGELLWERRVPGSRISEHVVTDGMLVVPSDDAQVHAYGLEDAGVRWRGELPSWPSVPATPSDLAAGGHTIYVGTEEGLSAIDARSGEIRWMHDGPRAQVAPLPGEGAVVSQHGGELLVLDAADGRPMRTIPLPTVAHQLEAHPTRWVARSPDRVVGIER